MRKNGFTLIELLAVIVILAIIALIATPIILGIINDAREKANERSVELYASAVRNGIAAYQLREGKEVLPGTYSETNKLPFEPEYDGNVECTNIIIGEDGTVSLDKCTVNGGTKEYSYGIETETPVAKACTIEKQDASKYSIGDIVTCNIGKTPDKFYVIEDADLTASTIQMLTEKNIHTTEYRQSDDAGTVAFSSTNYWSNGNLDPVDVYDMGTNNLKPIVDEYINYLNTKLTNALGSLLTYSQAEVLGCIHANGACAPGVNGSGNAAEWVYSTTYWTGSAVGAGYVWIVDSGGIYYCYDDSMYNINGRFGVRPVITISTNDIK